MQFLLGMTSGTMSTLLYMYGQEMVPQSFRPILHMILVMTETGLVETMTPIVISYTQDAFQIILVMGVVGFVHFIIMLFAPESPKFLYEKKRWKELHQILQDMAKINKVKKPELKFEEEVNPSSEHENKSQGLVSMLSSNGKNGDTTLRTNLIVMIILWSTCSLAFYIVSFYLTEFPGSIFTNGILMGLADLLVGPVTKLSTQCFSIKQIILTSLSITSVVSLALSTVNGSVEFGYVCVFLIRLNISLVF